MGAGEIDFSNREALSEAPSDDGSITLLWEKPETLEVVVEQADSPDFENAVVRYRGADSASVLTGLQGGVYYFRIAEAGAAEAGADRWSDPLEVRVEYIGRSRLVMLLLVGGLVVLATAGAIIGGSLLNRDGEGDA